MGDQGRPLPRRGICVEIWITRGSQFAHTFFLKNHIPGQGKSKHKSRNEHCVFEEEKEHPRGLNVSGTRQDWRGRSGPNHVETQVLVRCLNCILHQMGSHGKLFSRAMTWSDLYHTKINLAAMIKVNGVWEPLKSGSKETKKVALVLVQGRDDSSGGCEEQWLLKVQTGYIISWNCWRIGNGKAKAGE